MIIWLQSSGEHLGQNFAGCNHLAIISYHQCVISKHNFAISPNTDHVGESGDMQGFAILIADAVVCFKHAIIARLYRMSMATSREIDNTMQDYVHDTR